jgi:hypothetical protein
VKVFSSFIVPHFVYDSERWPLMQAQGDMLETAYSNCLRRILGVDIADCHNIEHLRGRCRIPSLRWFLAQRKLSWLGHMVRMLEEKYPRQVLFSLLCGAKRSRGRPT